MIFYLSPRHSSKPNHVAVIAITKLQLKTLLFAMFAKFKHQVKHLWRHMGHKSQSSI